MKALNILANCPDDKLYNKEVAISKQSNGFRRKIAQWLCGTALALSVSLVSPVIAYAGIFNETSAGEQPATSQPASFPVDTQIATISLFDILDILQTAEGEEEANDPFEGFNRAMFSFNQGFYDVILGPLADVYSVLPAEARTIVGSMLSNLSSPVIFINDVLQGEPERAFTTARRFFINSLFGFAGMADLASSFGLEEHDEDFGQTLAVWGVGEGAYLVLPILGPGNPRDILGRFLVDPIVDPVGTYLDNHGHDGWIWARYGVNAVHEFSLIKDDLEQLENTSVDYYAAVRSLYRQKRNIAISNGDEMKLPSIPDFEFGLGPTDLHDDPSIGDINDSSENDDQISALYQPELGQGDLTIDNPFASQFNPAENVILDASEVFWGMSLAPRKPAVLSLTQSAEMVVSSFSPTTGAK